MLHKIEQIFITYHLMNEYYNMPIKHLLVIQKISTKRSLYVSQNAPK